jgi:tetratricopeptide (TPR) repeat protein
MSNDTDRDLEKVHRLMEIDSRYVAAIPKVMPGQANQAVIGELQGVLKSYALLYREGEPSFKFYTLDDLVGKMANTTEFIARAYESLTDLEKAKEHYDRAAQLFESIGRKDDAERVRTTVARADLAATGDVDTDIKRLQDELAELSEQSLQRVGVQVELGELTSRAGDDFEATSILRTALDELQGLGYEEPQADDVASSLEATLRGIEDGTAKAGETKLEQLVLVRGLYMRLYLALAQAARETDPEEARRYQGLAQTLHGSEELVDKAVRQFAERLSAISGRSPKQ